MLYLLELGGVKYAAVGTRAEEGVVPTLARCAGCCRLFVSSEKRNGVIIFG